MSGEAKKIKFWLDGCDICFLAVAPEDITLKQLLKQCDRIKPDYCACGIRSWKEGDFDKTEIEIDYDDVRCVTEYPSFTIKDVNAMEDAG